MKGLVLEGNSTSLKVHIARQEACGHCKGCLSGYMKTEMDLTAKNLCEAEAGDWVELELQDNAFFNAIMISYGIPLVGFLLGILLGYYVVGPAVPISDSLVSFAMGIIGVLLSYAWIKSQNARWEAGRYTPLAMRLTTPDFDEDELD